MSRPSSFAFNVTAERERQKLQKKQVFQTAHQLCHNLLVIL